MGRVKGWFVLMIGVLGLALSAKTSATPLYGGYKGESPLWIEYRIGEVKTPLISSSIILGSDSEERTWTRIRISLVPFFTRLEFTRDYLDIQSVALNTLFPWPLQFGSEIAETDGDSPLWWVTAYLLLGVGGIDSEGNSWTETGIPGLYGVGTDISGNKWGWVKAGSLLWGIGENFSIEWDKEAADTRIARLEESLLSLQDHFDAHAGDALAERLTAPGFINAAQKCSESLPGAGKAYPYFSAVSRGGRIGGLPGGDGITEMNRAAHAACGSALALLLTGGIENDLALLLDDFVREVQPLLREIHPPH